MANISTDVFTTNFRLQMIGTEAGSGSHDLGSAPIEWRFYSGIESNKILTLMILQHTLDTVIWTGTFNWTLVKTAVNNVSASSGGNFMVPLSAVDVGGYVRIIYTDDSQVPVELSTFVVTYSNQNATLNWVTQSESNNMGWNIYRSISQTQEESVQLNYELIPGAGTTSEPTYYSYLDDSVQDFIQQHDTPGDITFRYWIENVDMDGESS